MADKTDALFRIHLETLNTLEKLVSVFSDWYKIGDSALKKPEILASDMKELRQDLIQSEKAVNEAVKENTADLERISKYFVSIGGDVRDSGSSNFNDEDARKNKQESKLILTKRLKEKMAEIIVAHNEILEVGKENTELCDSLSDMLA